jgi:hypothetical protein
MAPFLSTRAFVATSIMSALAASCLICFLWISASSGSAISSREEPADVLSASASVFGHIKTEDVTEKVDTTRKAVLSRMVKRSLVAPVAKPENHAKAPISKKVELVNSKKMKAYLQKEKNYEAEEKKKEQFFLRKQKNEAFLAETVAKQAEHKYNILTFPDKNMKRLTDFVEKKFPLPATIKSQDHVDNEHRIARHPVAEQHASLKLGSERIHAFQKEHHVTKLAPVSEVSTSDSGTNGKPQRRTPPRLPLSSTAF